MAVVHGQRGDLAAEPVSRPRPYVVQYRQVADSRYLRAFYWVWAAFLVPYLILRVAWVNWHNLLGPTALALESVTLLLTITCNYTTRRLFVPVHRPVDLARFVVDCVIPTHMEDVALIEPTIIAAQQVRASAMCCCGQLRAGGGAAAVPASRGRLLPPGHQPARQGGQPQQRPAAHGRRLRAGARRRPHAAAGLPRARHGVLRRPAHRLRPGTADVLQHRVVPVPPPAWPGGRVDRSCNRFRGFGGHGPREMAVGPATGGDRTVIGGVEHVSWLSAGSPDREGWSETGCCVSCARPTVRALEPVARCRSDRLVA